MGEGKGGGEINLRQGGTKLELKVRDNGKGITEKQISNPKSFGLIGIRERVYPWGGEVEIEGNPGKGTTVTVTIPLVEKQKAEGRKRSAECGMRNAECGIKKSRTMKKAEY
jgi:signal transduction histidine kinase